MPASRSRGTYALLVEVERAVDLGVGALGERRFDAGWYCYAGSALGSGGFARVERHREVAAGERDVRHWHLDYLLGAPQARLDAVWTAPAGADESAAERECAVAAALSGEPVAGFGASDCDCDAHLVAVPSLERAVAALDDVLAYRGLPD